MNWDFKKFNNYRAQVREKTNKVDYLVERFSTTDYSRLRVFRLTDNLDLNPLEPRENTNSDKILSEFKDKAETKKNKKSKAASIQEEYEKSRQAFLEATKSMDSRGRLRASKPEEEFVLEEESEEEDDFFAFLGEIEEDKEEKTINDEGMDELEESLFDFLYENETEEETENKAEETDGLLDLLEDIDDFVNTEVEDNLESDGDFSFEDDNKELENKIVKKDIDEVKSSLETEREEGESLLDLLLRFEDQNSEIIGREYIDTVPTFLNQVTLYDKLETFEKTKGADLIVEHQYGDKPMSVKMTNLLNDLLQVLPKDKSKVKEDLLTREHTILSDREVSYKTYIGLDKEEEPVKVVEILDVEGNVLSKYFETEEYEVRIFLDQNIRTFKERNKPLKETPYVKSIKPNPYRVKKNIGQDHRLVQLPPIEYFKSFLNMDYVEKANYWIADTEEKLIKVKEAINSLHPDHIISYDAETTGLDFHHWLPEEERDVLVTHSFSWEDNQSVIIPVRMKTRKNISPEIFKKHMKEIMETRRFLAHNGPADVRFNMPDGIRINIVEDTYFLAKHLMPYLQVDEASGKSTSRSNVTRGLDALIKRMFGVDLIDMNRYVFRPAGIDFDFSIMNDDYLIYYGCPDTDLLRQLWKIWRPKLEPIQENAYKATVRAACIMAENATYYGIALDQDIIYGGKSRASQTADHLEEVALALVGETKDTLQLGSATQLANFLYGKYGVPVTSETKRTPKGGLSADKEALGDIMAMKRDTPSDLFKEDIVGADGNVVRVGKTQLTKEYLNSLQFPFAALVRAWSDQTSDITANYNRLLNKAKDGIYYPEYRMGATATWRSTEGLQTVKGSLKGGLGTYGNDWYFLSMDFAAEELRLAVNQSNDDAFKDILEHPESDPHTSAGAELFELEQYQVDGGVRGKAKACNFGIIYGMKPYTLSTSMFGTRFPTQEQVDEATDTYNRYVYRFSEMIKALQPARKEVEQNGYLYNNLGFKNIYDDVLDLEDFERQIFDPNDLNPPTVRLDPLRYDQYKGALMNKAGNYPIQSWGAGLLLFLIIAFDKRIREEGLVDKVKLPVIVHDEVGLIIHESVDPYLMVKIMIEVFELDMSYLGRRTVPLYLGIGFGMSWGEAGSDEAELPVRLQHMIKEEYERGESPKNLKAEEVGPHFQDRIREYMRGRLKLALTEQLETGVYRTGDVVDILRNEVFVLNKGNEVFGFYNPGADSYDHEGIIEIITSEWSEEDEARGWKRELEIIETKPQPPKEIDEDSDPIDFFFEPMVHPKLMALGNRVIVDCTGLRKDIVQNLMKYLMYFNNPDDKNSKQLMMKLGANAIEVKGFKLTGLPLNAGSVIDDILEGQPAPIKKDGKIITQKINLNQVISLIKPESSGNKVEELIWEDNKEYYLIELSSFPEEDKQNKMNLIIKTLQPVLSTTKGKTIKVKVNKDSKESEIPYKLRGLSPDIIEQLNIVINS